MTMSGKDSAVQQERDQLQDIRSDYDAKYGFKVEEKYVVNFGLAEKGLTETIVRRISEHKKEPQWMLDFRLRSLEIFNSKPMPKWGSKLVADIDFTKVKYFVKASDRVGHTWDEVPDEIKETYERLGIPEAERKFLAGVSAQFESETVYHSMHEDLTKQGIIFLDMDTALREQPDLVKKYWATIIPPEDNKFAALNSAVWSGGSFIYVPKGVKCELPLQAYFRINTDNMGQFERTLIIVDEGASVHYIEGCTAPTYSTESLHSAVVELIALEGGRIRYTTVQNWANNIYNLVTKRAVAYKNARVEWLDGNIGSKLTMKYPAVVLAGEGAHGEVISIAFAGPGQHQDAGAKMTHAAPNTTSLINSKSITRDGGTSTYRGLVKIEANAWGSRSKVACDALLLDDRSHSVTVPTMELKEPNAVVEHEASVAKISEDMLFYLQARGFDEAQAKNMVVGGFISDFVRELPMEYAVEMNRLIEVEMIGSVG